MASHAAQHGHGHVTDPEDHHYTTLGVPHSKLAFWLFLGSDCFFFGSLIGTYMSYRGHSLVGPYPAEVFDVATTSISTFILLMSSFTMVLAVWGAKTNTRWMTTTFLIVTALLGASFVGFQVYEFNHFSNLGLQPQTNLFGSTFYVLTGFHGAHVALGVVWLGLQTVWYNFKWVRSDEGLAVEIAGLYWHFVDIVWIVIFTVIYLLEYSSATTTPGFG
jgi:heme/copper-type cytochrome/quinol oxidase subunit 3